MNNPTNKHKGPPRKGTEKNQIPSDSTATTTDGIRCTCGKTLKNPKGLKIHQTKMSCLLNGRTPQRTGEAINTTANVVLVAEPDKTEEEPGPESPHSVRSLQAARVQQKSSKPVQHRIKWPTASEEWVHFDEDVDNILKTTSKGSVDHKLQTMCTLITSIGAERFGVIEKGKKDHHPKPNRRAVRISQLRLELKSLKKQFKAEEEVEKKLALTQLRNITRQKLITLRRAEQHRKKGRERAQKRKAFMSNPFGFSKRLLSRKKSGYLSCSEDVMNNHLKSTFSDKTREQDLGPCENLIDPPKPSKDFVIREPTLKEVKTVVQTARSCSAPGPSGVPYRVYKHCPRLLVRLWKLLKVIWRRKAIPSQWRSAEGIWLPKEENSCEIEQFRIISLLCVEGKIFFKIMAQRLTEFLLENDYLDTSVQKGGVPGMSGCLEHTGVVTQLIREARTNKGNLAVLWLDLTNAYGSIPHKLVETALIKHHIPEGIRNLIMNYYNNFKLRASSELTTSNWQQLEKGIITGCTISVSLFTLAINMLVKSAETECRGPVSSSGTQQPPIRAFIDDLTVTAPSVHGCRWLLRGLQRLISWARMDFKPTKSRSLVLEKGKVVDKHRFTVGGVTIPTLREKPVKSLGKIFNSSLKDTSSVQLMKEDLRDWLEAIEKTGLPGKYKAWMYQHGVLPRLLWPLLVYDVPITTVELLERTISQFLRRWLGLPRSLSSIALYSNATTLQLPLSSVTEEFKVTRAREVMLYRDSTDIRVSSANIKVKTGRKWSAHEAVERAEARLQHSVIVGNVAVGRAGLGSYHRQLYNKASKKEKRKMVQDEIRKEEEEIRLAKMVAMSHQGAWTRWENIDQRKISWSELWRSDPTRIRFLVQSTYNVLPSPVNLYLWKLADSPICQLCQGNGTLEHILSSCPRALGEGRYRWRHDQVLKAVAKSVSEALLKSKNQRTPQHEIRFIKAGERIHQKPHRTGGLLATARDWDLQVDLGRQLKFPEKILTTSLRPDMVLTSEATKQVVILELTVPWEDRIEEANCRKTAKYQELAAECRINGWKARNEPFEVGCRGFTGRSLLNTFKTLGIRGQQCRRAITEITGVAERASRWLWIRRSDVWISATRSQTGN